MFDKNKLAFNLQKRRSGRNVKRKRYTESIDVQFSGDDDETDFLPQETLRKPEPIVEMNVSLGFIL